MVSDTALPLTEGVRTLGESTGREPDVRPLVMLSDTDEVKLPTAWTDRAKTAS